ncbi:DUF2863 family protein [Herbaspirillum sp. DW155]|uniref:DUF2863 family protein n=1 Tax=Herbaspirillum sp. DW155 TaxID=3095609 RepID=UPI0030897DC2|nr:DUF2863 family protein [Herbaspirillum sp. DW155]
MNQAKRPSGKPQPGASKKAGPKPAPKPMSAGPAREKPKTHVSTEAARRRQHQAHAASQSLDEDELRVQQMVALASAVAADAPDRTGRRIGQDELERMVRNTLRERDDDTLYEALEQLRYDDPRGHAFLREVVEEGADIIVLRRGEKELEINAFLIPLLARTRGGLREDRALADGDAFDALRESIQKAGLESARARVVLVHHLYHPEEINALSFSEVEAMNRDAFASLTDKKILSVPAIERSMRGWPASHFAPDDEALELRFLLGFSLKDVDDPFYAIPQEEAAADAYFEARAQRFRQWSEEITPLMQQCLTGRSGEAAQCQLHFLYQDLFHGAKHTGNGEYRTLQMLSELEAGLEQAGAQAAQATAFLALPDEEEDRTLQVVLRGAQGELARSFHLVDGDLQAVLLDAADAVASLGVAGVRLADGFDADGLPLRARDFPMA